MTDDNLETIELDLPDDVALWMFRQLCERNIRPSDFIAEIMHEYILKKEDDDED